MAPGPIRHRLGRRTFERVGPLTRSTEQVIGTAHAVPICLQIANGAEWAKRASRMQVLLVWTLSVWTLSAHLANQQPYRETACGYACHHDFGDCIRTGKGNYFARFSAVRDRDDFPSVTRSSFRAFTLTVPFRRHIHPTVERSDSELRLRVGSKLDRQALVLQHVLRVRADRRSADHALHLGSQTPVLLVLDSEFLAAFGADAFRRPRRIPDYIDLTCVYAVDAEDGHADVAADLGVRRAALRS